MDGVPAVMLLPGVLHYEGGNYTLASERFDRLLSLQPLNIKGRRLLGAAQYQAGNFSAAAQALQPLIERGDADSYSLTLAARAHEALGKPQIAAQLLDRASLPVRNDATGFAGAGPPGLLAGEAYRKGGAEGRSWSG